VDSAAGTPVGSTVGATVGATTWSTVGATVGAIVGTTEGSRNIVLAPVWVNIPLEIPRKNMNIAFMTKKGSIIK
jgi:outer membrane lipoprotein SlyB